jgi:hypothetical protein
MIRKLALAVVMVAFIAAPSFAAVQNVKVSGDIDTTSVIRNNFDFGATANTNGALNEVLSQVGLKVQADLTDNVSATIKLLNERLWGSESTSNTTVDLEAAFVTLKEFLYSPLTLQIGRQPLQYGNQLIIGKNTSTSPNISTAADLSKDINFDAIKAVLNYDPLTIDLFASKVSGTTVVSGNIGGVDTTNNLYGINAAYKLGDKMSTVIEAYTFIDINHNGDFGGVNQTKGDAIYVPGLRLSTNPIEGLNFQLEGALELGKVGMSTGTSTDNRKLAAFALQGYTSYVLPVLKNLKPIVSGSYTYLSGDKRQDAAGQGAVQSGTTKAWQQLYYNQNVGRIWSAILGTKSDSSLVQLTGSLNPIQDLTTALSWSGLWLNHKNTPIGSLANGSTYLGSELDADLTYAYTEDVKFGLSAGVFLTGKAFDSTANSKNASQVLTSVNVAF